ncbi:MAG: hypothetical protein R6U04_06980 [Bacteroidales bacterium]
MTGKNETAYWEQIENYIQNEFNVLPEVHNILFLIGIQELGYGFQKLDKDTKVKVINFASIFVLKYINDKDIAHIKNNFPDRYEKDYETKYEEEIYKLAIIRYFREKNILKNNNK